MVIFEAVNPGLMGLAFGMLVSMPVVLVLNQTGIGFSLAP
jgi:hypothetical protein